jgi:hypothetical protein
MSNFRIPIQFQPHNQVSCKCKIAAKNPYIGKSYLPMKTFCIGLPSGVAAMIADLVGDCMN